MRGHLSHSEALQGSMLSRLGLRTSPFITDGNMDSEV